MKKNIVIIFIAAMGLVLGLGDIPCICAQEEAPDEFTLEEITVTVLRRESAVQDTPMSITAISGTTLREQGKTTLLEILQDIPGVSIRTDTHGAKFFIRGVTENLAFSAEQPTATYTDGIYVAVSGEARGGFYDIERLEVARGPQGTLFGFNALGGSVNIISRDPVLDTFEGYGNFEVGNYSSLKTDGAVNVPLSESFAMRGAFLIENRDGYLSNGLDDSVMRSGRIKLLWRPVNDFFQMILNTDLTRRGGLGGSNAGPHDPSTGLIEDLPNPWFSSYEGGSTYHFNHQTGLRSSARFEWYLDIGTLFFQASYSNYFTRQYHVTTSARNQQNEYTTVTQELRMNSPEDSPLTWSTGINYWKKKAPVISADEITPYNNSMTQGIFGQVSYPFSDSLRVTAGLRYSKDSNERARYLVDDPASMVAKSASYDAPTWKLGVEKDIGEDSLLYAQAGTGYRTGGFHGLRGTLTAYDPMEMLAYSVGSKNRFLNSSLQLNGELYLYQYKSYQLRWDEYDDEGNYLNHIVNSSDVVFYGADLDISYLLTERDKINFAVAYLHTDLGLFDPAGGLDQYNHFESDHSPELTLNLNYEHIWSLENGGDLRLNFSTHYETDSWTVFMRPPGSKQPAYHTSNISIKYNLPDGKWGIQGYMRNIENYPVLSHWWTPLSGTAGQYMLQAPRTFGIIVSVNY